LRIVPGETALAFYTAENPTDKPIVGIATYSVLPIEASKYFHKIQCFCFEEQRLNPHEKVDLPVFFFLDPEISSDQRLKRCSEIILNYTFFEAKKAKFHIPGITTPEYSATQESEVLPEVEKTLLIPLGMLLNTKFSVVLKTSIICQETCIKAKNRPKLSEFYVVEVCELHIPAAIENQSKFVNQRVHEIETFFGNLCSELVSYTRRTSKLRNNGDEIARILLDYSNKEQINRTTSDALRKVSEYFVTLEDYRNTEIDRIVGKVVNPLAAYGEEIKHIKKQPKVGSIIKL
ncbi:putative cytochrome C oxidase assembly protein cox11, partial [Schistosoma mansoni]|uniref:putative cytochrome C oxidase assembly protein cox11 n=1 Tax=Schistosoma mansoni TaxID=6183 RepID=UPI00022DC061